jgi:hypothetical protein
MGDFGEGKALSSKLAGLEAFVWGEGSVFAVVTKVGRAAAHVTEGAKEGAADLGPQFVLRENLTYYTTGSWDVAHGVDAPKTLAMAVLK